MKRTEGLDITGDDVKRREYALSTLLSQMDIPDMRKDTSKLTNLRWINRNISISNGSHPMHDTAHNLLKWLRRWHQVGKVTVGDR